MDCPYCFSGIHEDATICPHCRSDLGAIKPLLKRLGVLEQRVEALSTGLVNSDARESMAARQAEEVLAEAAGNDTQVQEAVPWVELGWQRLIIGTLVISAGLVFLHWLLIFIYDIRPLVLRVVTLVLPMLAGYVLLRHHVVSLVKLSMGSSALGALSVMGMLSVTAWLDNVPVWPNSIREWREVFEYVMGIALGLFSAGLVVRLLHDWSVSHARARLRQGKWFFLEKNPDGSVKAAKFAMEVSKFVNAAAPVASGATALYAGLKSVLAN